LRRLAISLSLVLSLTGLMLCLRLLWIHVTVYSGGVTESLFCGGSGVLSCDQVAAHESSTVLGVPLPAWGALFYAVALSLCIAVACLRESDRKAAAAAGTLVSALAVCFDGYLAAVMVFEVEALCVLCLATYAVNLLLLLCFLAVARCEPASVEWRRLGPSWRDLLHGAESDYYRSVFKGGLALATLIGCAVLLVLCLEPMVQIRAYGESQVRDFLSRARHGTPEVSMKAFADQPWAGPEDAPLQVVLFGDFECSLCRSITETLEGLRERRPGEIRVAFVNSPVSSKCNADIPEDYHEHACWLARAGECAAEQGRFWEFHDLLYRELSLREARPSDVEPRLAGLGLDEDALRTCLESGKGGEAVAADVALARSLAITTTPSLVINGFVKRGTMFPWMLEEIVTELLDRSDETFVAAEAGPG
jgi:protein-disulfide isomerase/uncharacterized membrane protein